MDSEIFPPTYTKGQLYASPTRLLVEQYKFAFGHFADPFASLHKDILCARSWKVYITQLEDAIAHRPLGEVINAVQHQEAEQQSFSNTSASPQGYLSNPAAGIDLNRSNYTRRILANFLASMKRIQEKAISLNESLEGYNSENPIYYEPQESKMGQWTVEEVLGQYTSLHKKVNLDSDVKRPASDTAMFKQAYEAAIAVLRKKNVEEIIEFLMHFEGRLKTLSDSITDIHTPQSQIDGYVRDAKWISSLKDSLYNNVIFPALSGGRTLMQICDDSMRARNKNQNPDDANNPVKS